MKPANQNTMEAFEFTLKNKAEAQKYIARYPKGREESAVMPLLWLAQKQSGGWLPQPAMEYVAEYLKMPIIKVLEVASFYTMYNLKPVGENFVQICRTTPCWLRGADKLTEACKSHLGVGSNKITPDGKFSFMEVECLGACANAPMVQINDDYYEDLDEDRLIALLDDLKAGKKRAVGSQVGRKASEPFNRSEPKGKKTGKEK